MTTTWNPSDKVASITLSAGNLAAEQTDPGGSGGSGPGKVRATDWGASTQFFEITVNAVATGSPEAVSAIGISNASSSLVIALDSVGSLLWFADGWLLGPGINTNIGTGWGAGDVIGYEYSGKFYKNGTLVYTFGGTLPSGNIYPTALLYAFHDKVTANFGATTFAHDPGGVTAWATDTSTPRNITYNKTLPSIFQIATLYTGVPAPIVSTGGFFPDTIAAVLAGNVVRLDLLVMFDFASGPMRLWQGFGTLVTNDTNEWSGLGELGQISDIESSIGGTAPQAKFTLSGVDPTIVASAIDDGTEIYGRDCNVYMQFFNSDYTCLDNPYVIWAGTMDTVRIIQRGPSECQVELTAETIFARRALPPLGNLTDREQQKFFPGDNGLVFMPSLMNKTAIWPVILPGFP